MKYLLLSSSSVPPSVEDASIPCPPISTVVGGDLSVIPQPVPAQLPTARPILEVQATGQVPPSSAPSTVSPLPALEGDIIESILENLLQSDLQPDTSPADQPEATLGAIHQVPEQPTLDIENHTAAILQPVPTQLPTAPPLLEVQPTGKVSPPLAPSTSSPLPPPEGDIIEIILENLLQSDLQPDSNPADQPEETLGTVHRAPEQPARSPNTALEIVHPTDAAIPQLPARGIRRHLRSIGRKRKIEEVAVRSDATPRRVKRVAVGTPYGRFQHPEREAQVSSDYEDAIEPNVPHQLSDEVEDLGEQPEGPVIKIGSCRGFDYMVVKVINPLPCSECSNRYVDQKSLDKHIKKEHVKGDIPCDHCSRMFKNGINLRRHIANIHTGDLVAICEVCGATFSTAISCTEHKREVHNISPPSAGRGGNSNRGANPQCKDLIIYKCSSCHHSSASKSNLVRHILIIHIRSREHKCSYCEKAFPTKNNREIHEASVHRDQLREE